MYVSHLFGYHFIFLGAVLRLQTCKIQACFSQRVGSLCDSWLPVAPMISNPPSSLCAIFHRLFIDLFVILLVIVLCCRLL